jgi:hypothetical protein
MRTRARSDAECIVRFCLGSQEYKRREVQGFARAVARMDRDRLVHLLYRANLLPLFESEIERLGIEPSLLPWIRPYRVYQGVFNRELLRILDALAERLGSLRPVLLKGPAFWGHLYEDPSLRPVKDLDILATDETTIGALCGALLELGFAEVPSILDMEHYELPEYRKSVEVEAEGSTAECLALVCSRYAPPRLRQEAGNRFSLTIPVEVHTALFLFTDGTSPELRPHHLADWRLRPRYRVLSPAANLPYLSVKLDFDAERHVGRSVKLLADLVRIVADATPADVALSLETAEEWCATGSYRTVLGTLAELTPEIEYLGLPRSSRDPLSDLVEDILSHQTIEVLQ